MYKYLIFLISLLLITNASDNGIEVISSNDDHIIVSYTPRVTGVSSIRTRDGFDTFLPQIKSAYNIENEQGKPQYHVVPINITVPSKDSYSVSLVGNIEYEIMSNMMTPVAKRYDYAPDHGVFQINNNYFERKDTPEIKYEYAGISRGKHILNVTLTAARYDAASGNILIPKNIKFRIDFNSKNITKGNSQVNSPVFTLNHFESSKWIDNDKLKRKVKLQNDGRILSDGKWLKVKVTQEGIHRVTSSQLSGLGINIPKDKLNSIKVFSNGGKTLSESVESSLENKLIEQHINVTTNSNGDLQDIIFYGRGTTGFEYDNENDEFRRYFNPYSNDSYYLLTWGGDERIEIEQDIFNSEIVNRPFSYIHRYFYEQDFENPYPSGGGRQFFGEPFFDKSFTTRLHNLDRNGEIFYRIMLAHKSSSAASFELREGNYLLDDNVRIDRATGYTVARRTEFSKLIPANEIASDNRSTLHIKYDENIASPGYLDYYEIHYPRSFTAINNSLSFFTDKSWNGGTEIIVNGFSPDSKYAYDVSDPKSPKPLQNFASDMDKVILKLDLDENPKQVFLSSEVLNTSIELIEFEDLRNNDSDAEVIVITHPQLLQSANQYKNYRESNSELKVEVFNTDHIFNEFSYGVKDVTAIRDFISHAYFNWSNRPRYVVLWGDGHIDYREINHSETNFVPPFLSEDDKSFLSEIQTTCYDDYFVRVDGEDNLIDLSIGRVPIVSNTEGAAYVNKIDYYENSSDNGLWRSKLTLVADDGKAGGDDNDGSLHTRHAEALSHEYISRDIQQNKIYLIEYPTEYTSSGRRKPEASSDLVSALREDGSLILNWTGHGNPRLWAHEQIFVQENTVKELDNKSKLSFISAATCEFGRFDQTTGRTASEDLVLSEKGGAIALFASTRLVFAGENSDLTNLFYEKLFERNPIDGKYYRIGDILYNVKQTRNRDNDEKYLILGDPTLRILIPDHKIMIDRIDENEISGTDDQINLKGLSTVNISGRILDPLDNFKSDFNGDIVFTLFDGDRDLRLEEDGEKYFFSSYGGLLTRGTFDVVNGNFEAKFTLPKDISYSQNNGRMFAYAESNNGDYAKGSFTNFVVSGIDDNPPSDFDGPETKLYLDSRGFVEGDVVSNEPLLIVDIQDSLGVNSTGVGIGHRIEAWVNDEPGAYDLTDSYTAWTTDTTNGGTASTVLRNLKPGLNKVTVRVWDILNNFTIDSTFFYIRDEADGLWIGDIRSYPNPFETETEVAFRHNLTPPFDVEVNIYSSNGNHIRTLSEERIFESYEGGLMWDGLDKYGKSISQGAYVYQVTLTDTDGRSISKSGLVSLKMK